MSELPAYQSVQKRAAAGNKLPVDLRWYLDPFGLSDIGRSRVPKRKQPGRDPVKLAKSEGFDAILAAGGVVSLAAGPYVPCIGRASMLRRHIDEPCECW